LADWGYDTEALIAKAKESGMAPVIPPRKNRKEQRLYDKALYKHRHLVENLVTTRSGPTRFTPFPKITTKQVGFLFELGRKGVYKE